MYIYFEVFSSFLKTFFFFLFEEQNIKISKMNWLQIYYLLLHCYFPLSQNKQSSLWNRISTAPKCSQEHNREIKFNQGGKNMSK